MRNIFKAIDPKGIPILFICLTLAYLSVNLPPAYAVACIILLCPLGVGFLFKDEERKKAENNFQLYGTAWCKGAFLCFFIIGPIVAFIVVIFKCTTSILKTF
jgi:hypothetical protein